MKIRLLHICFALVLGAAVTAPAAEVKLTGIVCEFFGKVALLEVGSKKPSLKAGEKFETVEVTAIDEKAAKVTIVQAGKKTELDLDGQEGVPNQTFNLKGASLEQVLDIYQDTAGRTLLRSPALVGAKIDLKSAAGLSPVEAEQALAGVLQEKGTVVVMRHDKFAFAVPFSQVPRLANLKAPPAPPKTEDKTAEKFPPGFMKFANADRTQVLDIYQEMSSQTVLISPNAPHAKVTLRSQTELSRPEALWLLDAALRLGGVALVPDGKFVFVLPATRNVSAPAIPPNPLAAKLKDESFPPGRLKFVQAGVAQVLPVYAELAGLKSAVDSKLPADATSSTKFSLRSQTALTRAESLYALDAMAVLNNVRFVLAENGKLKLISTAPAQPDAETK